MATVRRGCQTHARAVGTVAPSDDATAILATRPTYLGVLSYLSGRITMAYKGETPVEATVSMVIIRACSRCGGKREADKPCANCGNSDSPVTHDVGVQAFHSDNPLRQLAWELVGKPRAERRAQRANREASGGNRS